jgi:signal recognition particle receptor subunit beta
MVLFNYSTKELTAKIVYYGPGLCGKTTNLQYIHENISDNVKGKMLSLATKTDRTLFFDFLPMDLGEIRGMKTRMQLYTVPGQVFYNETRKLVLKGVDGIVFVADSQKEMLNPNVESFNNLEENLKTHGMVLQQIPHVIQFNKRDLPKLASLEEMNAAINRYNAPFYESVATTGIGVQDTLKAITKLVLLNLTRKYEPRTAGAGAQPQPPAPAPAPAKSAPKPAAKPRPTVAAPAPAPPVQGIPLSAPPAPSAAMPRAAQASAAPKPDRPAAPPAAARIESAAPRPPAPPMPPPMARKPPSLEGAFGDDTMANDLLCEVGAAPLDSPGPAIRTEVDITEHLSADDGVADAAQDFGDPLVRLTEVVNDHELFHDPGLDVARLAAGECREIVVPLQIGREGEAVRRFKLSLKLQLHPVD